MDRFGDEGAGVFPEDVETDARGSAPFEELLSQLDWARMRDDDESILSILELIMLQKLIDFLRSFPVTMLPDAAQLTVVHMALEAAENGGYIRRPDVRVLTPMGLEVAAEDQHGWYFVALRSRARELARRKRDNDRRRTSKPTLNVETDVERRSAPTLNVESDVERRCVQSSEECTHSEEDCLRPNTVLPSVPSLPSVIGIPHGPAGARSVEHQAPSTVPGLLFPEMEEPAPEQEKPKKPRAPHPWEPLYQAVKEVTESDDRPSIRKFLWKVAYDLYHADPPYTPEEVLKLPAILEQQPWWEQSGKVISIAVLQKHIGLVRRVAEELPLLELPAMTLAELEREAIRSYRETIREGR